MLFLLRSHRLRAILTTVFVALLASGQPISLVRAAASPSSDWPNDAASPFAPLTGPALILRIGLSDTDASAALSAGPRRASSDAPTDQAIRAIKVRSQRQLSRFSIRLSLRARSAATASAAAPPATRPAAPSSGGTFSKEDFESLSKLINETPLEQMDLEFFKKVYRYNKAPDMLKLIMGRTDNQIPEKNRRLGNLRKWYDWSENQGKYARDQHITIENTNQGKDNGSRSDLDATANILEFDSAKGEFVIRDKAVADLIKNQTQVYAKDGLTPDNVDVTIFNGDTWMPDWADSRMSYTEFRRKLFANTADLKNRKGAYFVPGAHKEQAHDRALAEGHSIHIGWDYIKNVPTINGQPVEFDYKRGEIINAETKEPIQEYNTKQMAERGVIRRYANVKAVETKESWRRGLGNTVQNMKEALSHDEPLSRNKYFIERSVDQAAGRFVDWSDLAVIEALGAQTHLGQHTYVEIHASDMDAATKAAWKKAFIQQAFGIADGNADKIREIQSVLDRSSEIQLDKTGKWADKHTADYAKRRGDYYKDEMAEAEKTINDQWESLQKRHEAVNRRITEKNQQRPAGQQVPLEPDLDKHDLALKEAERLFVEKQRSIMIEGGVRVVQESFRRDFTPEGMRRFNRQSFNNPENNRKIMLERSLELALLLDVIETSPGFKAEQRNALRERVLNSVPTEARPLVEKMAKIAELKMGLLGGAGLEQVTRAATGMTDKPVAEMLAEVEEEAKRLLGEDVAAKPSPLPMNEVRGWLFDAISENLGPTQRKAFEKAWEAGKRGLIAKFGGTAYLNEIVNQADFLMMSGAALAMINAYQQHCASQSSVLNEDCVSGLAWEAGQQTFYMLPGVNTGFLILSGLRAINEGNPEGFITLGLGTAALPSVARLIGVSGGVFIKFYIALQIAKLGYAVTIGHAIQAMESDALEQAFKANAEPGKQARRYNYANQPYSISRADTPTTPLLSDKIRVEADSWSDDRRYSEAKERFAPSIQEELDALGLKPGSDEWYRKRVEIIRNYTDLLPYSQRVQQIYKVFGPDVQAMIDNARANGQSPAGEDLIGLKVCLEVSDEALDKKYQTPRSFFEFGRWWRGEKKSKEKDQGEAYAKCLQQAIEADRATLTPVFNKYLDGWIARQNNRADYDTPDMRNALVTALIRHYITQRHLDLGYETERQLRRAAREARNVAQARMNIAGNLKQALEETKKQAQERLEQAAQRNFAGEPPAEAAAKPEIKLRAPSQALRLGRDAQIDFGVRGQYYAEKSADAAKNSWIPMLQSEITGVSLDQPANLVMTKELEEELKTQPGEPPRRFIKVDEKLTGELQDASGKKMASAETTLNYFDLLPKWQGRISVEVRAEGPATKDKSDPRRGYAYANAPVKISGPAKDEKLSELSVNSYAGVYFDKLPVGKFAIHVEPAAGDKEHQPVDATIELSDYTVIWGGEPKEEDGQYLYLDRFDDAQNGRPAGDTKRMALVRWKDYDSITVVLPYVEPPKKEEKPPEKPVEQPVAQNPPKPTDPNKPLVTPPAKTGPDPKTVAECQGLLAQAQQLMAAGDTAGAQKLLQQLQQKNCGALDPAINQGIDAAGQEIENKVNTLINELNQQLSAAACEYEGAMRVVEQIRQINPNHPALSKLNISELAQFAAAQRDARVFLRQGKAAIESKNLDGAISALASALGVANLPACMRPPMTALKTELERRKEFIALTQEVEEATRQCDYTRAQQAVGSITRLTPRYDFINEWITRETPKLAELLQRRQQAIQFIREAAAIATQAETAAAATPVDWNQVSLLVDNAAKKLEEADRVAPKCLKERDQMDPIRQRLLGLQRNKPAQIQTSIVLLIDTSGSMGQNNKMENAKAAARASVRNATKTTEMAILNFDGGCSGGAVRVACSFTSDINALLAAIDGLRPGSGTPMYIAAAVATEYVKKNGHGKTGLVVLMSDGGDTCRDQQAQAAAAIRSSNIPVNTIGYDVGTDGQAQGDLRNLATLTNGRSYSASTADPKEIVNAFKLAMLPSLFKDFDRAESGSAVQGHISAAKMMIQQQDLNGATFQLQQAYQLAPNSAAVNYDLALVHEANDKPLSAIKHAQNYLSLAPNALDRGDIEVRIAQMQKEVQENPRAQYDPNSCRDIYNWALSERETAKRAGNPARLQAVLEIQIAAQRGDCTNARNLQESYKQRFR